MRPAFARAAVAACRRAPLSLRLTLRIFACYRHRRPMPTTAVILAGTLPLFDVEMAEYRRMTRAVGLLLDNA